MVTGQLLIARSSLLFAVTYETSFIQIDLLSRFAAPPFMISLKVRWPIDNKS